ncbi:heterokaryon incompatibility protein-domain-containing protein, partial [Leptodontidium sp. 2 PMI_412]
MDTDATLRFPTSTSTESTNTVEYQYQPLHGDLTFRILTCHPGAYDDEVSISLAHANFDCETPEYEALSYLWGDTKVTVAIQCEGQSLQVTSNLFGALRRIRNEALPRQLWIDAICINQANLSERNKQVLLMSRIYRLALKVLIWIGEE